MRQKMVEQQFHSDDVDFLSNGFRIRDNGTDH